MVEAVTEGAVVVVVIVVAVAGPVVYFSVQFL
jgi:hypothetical protein